METAGIYLEAVNFVTRSRNASCSALQRRFHIGYAAAVELRRVLLCDPFISGLLAGIDSPFDIETNYSTISLLNEIAECSGRESRGISIGPRELNFALMGARNSGRIRIQSGWGQSDGPDRVTAALAGALSSPRFLEELKTAYGIALIVTSASRSLMGREIKELNNALGAHVRKDCNSVLGICYDENLPPELLRVVVIVSSDCATVD